MSSQNWRIEKGAVDYFGHKQKQLDVADRRPVLRKASDLVGPGLGAFTTRLTNYNDILALYNGFFSSAPGAANAPNATEAFTGYVISDAEIGAQQVFRGLTSGTQFVRTALRNPADANSITWGNWI